MVPPLSGASNVVYPQLNIDLEINRRSRVSMEKRCPDDTSIARGHLYDVKTAKKQTFVSAFLHFCYTNQIKPLLICHNSIHER